MKSGKSNRDKSSVLEDKGKFGDNRADEKLSHMGSKPGTSKDRAQRPIADKQDEE